MDRYRMSRMDYQNRMDAQSNRMMRSGCAPVRPSVESRETCGCETQQEDIRMPLAMGYVPIQKFKTTFEECKALQVGTVFPELCKPFVGKRGKVC